jgi:rod shape-determining protein MreC
MFFLRKYKIIIFVTFVLVSVFITVAYHMRYGTNKSFLRKIMLETSSPAQRVLSGSIQSVKDAWVRYLLLVGIQEENKKLKKKINELQAIIVSYQEGY